MIRKPKNKEYIIKEYIIPEYTQKNIDIIQRNGFNLVAISYFNFEDVYVFNTDDEAEEAFRLLGAAKDSSDAILDGWWYGRKNFVNTLKQLIDNGDEILVHWMPSSEGSNDSNKSKI